MLTLAHIIVLIVFSVFSLPPVLLLMVPLAYIWWIGRGLIEGGAEVDIEKLEAVLAERWANPKELASYMVRYWPALKYCASATARQQTCMSLAMLQIGGGAWVLWKASIITGAAMLIQGAILWWMATRVNRPLSMYRDQRVRGAQDEFCRTEWLNAVSALIAYAELHPMSGNASYVVANLLRDELVGSEIAALRTRGWASP